MSTRRVAFGVAANVFEKIVVAVVQLATVPVLAVAWGVNVYGSWVLLSTIPSFIAMSDFGFASAAGTRMTMLVANDRRREAATVFQSAWVAVLVSSTAMITLALAAAWVVPDNVLPTAHGFDQFDARITLSLLLLYGIVALQGSIFVAGFRCSGLFAVGTTWTGVTILGENLAAIVAVLMGGRPVAAAAALLLARIVALVVQAALLRRMVPWLKMGLRLARRAEIRALVSPALAVMALPVGQASFLQGTAIALGIALSPAAVPAFTAARTLSRIGLQFTQLLVHALMPEYSAAVAREDRHAQAVMLALTLATAAVVVVPFALAFILFGPEIMLIWTRGVIRPDRLLMIMMAVTIVLGGIWNPLSNLILAMNRHAGFAYPYVVLAVLTIPATYLLSQWLGASGAALSIALLDAGMCAVIFYLGRRLFVSPAELLDATMHLRSTVATMLRRRQAAR